MARHIRARTDFRKTGTRRAPFPGRPGHPGALPSRPGALRPPHRKPRQLACRGGSFYRGSARAVSSVGQSTWLTPRGSGVRAPHRPPAPPRRDARRTADLSDLCRNRYRQTAVVARDVVRASARSRPRGERGRAGGCRRSAARPKTRSGARGGRGGHAGLPIELQKISADHRLRRRASGGGRPPRRSRRRPSAPRPPVRPGLGPGSGGARRGPPHVRR